MLQFVDYSRSMQLRSFGDVVGRSLQIKIVCLRYTISSMAYCYNQLTRLVPIGADGDFNFAHAQFGPRTPYIQVVGLIS